jgi:hypothetical protein
MRTEAFEDVQEAARVLTGALLAGLGTRLRDPGSIGFPTVVAG